MKAFALLVASIVSLVACRSAETTNSSTTTASVIPAISSQSASATSVLKDYHKAMIAGDSVKARSLATGTALAIIEYQFYHSKSDDAMTFTYGPENIIRDTCYIPMRVRNAATRDPEVQGKAILVKVNGDWKVEKIAMHK